LLFSVLIKARLLGVENKAIEMMTALRDCALATLGKNDF